MNYYIIVVYDNNANEIRGYVCATSDISDASLLAIKMCESSHACLLKIRELPFGISAEELKECCNLELSWVKGVLNNAIVRDYK